MPLDRIWAHNTHNVRPIYLSHAQHVIGQTIVTMKVAPEEFRSVHDGLPSDGFRFAIMMNPIFKDILLQTVRSFVANGDFMIIAAEVPK